MPTNQETGREGEDLATAFLEERGFRILERNFRFMREEVDIIAFEPTPRDDGGVIVFVEVKARRGDGYGAPEAAVDLKKQKAIKRVAEAYLHERRLIPSPVRFDVIAIRLDASPPAIEHFTHAFGHNA